MSKASWDGEQIYAVALGSNRPLRGGLGPAAILKAATARLDAPPLRLLAASPILSSAPIGPSNRRYANAAALVAAPLAPMAMLAALQAIEQAFGRKRTRRWGARTLDLDIILWSGGRVRGRRLTTPHRAYLDRAFVLTPLAAVAPRWRDPWTGRPVAALAAQLRAPKPVDRPPPRL